MCPAFSTRPGLISNNVPQTARHAIENKKPSSGALLLRTYWIFLWGVHQVLWPVHRESLIPNRMSGGPSTSRRNERAVNPIVPLNAVVTYVGSKLLTNSQLKFVARERKCAQQLRREAIVHSFGL